MSPADPIATEDRLETDLLFDVQCAIVGVPPMHVTNTEYVPQARRRPNAVVDRHAVIVAARKAIRDRFALVRATPAGLAALDVERLARATAAVVGWSGPLDYHREWAAKVAREYAALLTEGVSSGQHG